MNPKPVSSVTFNQPVSLPEHFDVLRQTIVNRNIGGNGPFTKRCEALLEKVSGKPVRIVTSATHALEAMALLANIEAGDEVIVPSYTFVSTANAFALRGANIRFADNDEYGNILPSEIERLYSPKTKAVVAVHYAGASADMDKIVEICKAKRVFLFEDAAQALGASYKGRPLGTFGELGCYSFHETKNVTSGEGGALILGDSSLLERTEVLREKGTDRSRFFQGLVDKYTWVDIGSSFVLSDLNSAYLYPQLEILDRINARRGEIRGMYRAELATALERAGVRILDTPSYNLPNHHIFAIICATPRQRQDFLAFMNSRSVLCTFHYVSLHTSPFAKRFAKGGRVDELPGCEKFSACLVRLPLYYNMTDEEAQFVIEAVKAWLK
ncbi:MAG: dTDP-4-amino-4,6-dideoxygalactose transaminase [Deltaproteobacteria bacterium]|nr:dTDP-4-amino-4,6-dideoxygalactose transaminase [Deltaproteobacteria bacterium]